MIQLNEIFSFLQTTSQKIGLFYNTNPISLFNRFYHEASMKISACYVGSFHF